MFPRLVVLTSVWNRESSCVLLIAIPRTYWHALMSVLVSRLHRFSLSIARRSHVNGSTVDARYKEYFGFIYL